jgi:hypothetical protein
MRSSKRNINSESNVSPTESDANNSGNYSSYGICIDEDAIRRARKNALRGKALASRCPNNQAWKAMVKKHGLPWKRIKTAEQFVHFYDEATDENVKWPVVSRLATFIDMYDEGKVIDDDGNIHVREYRYRVHTKDFIRTPAKRRTTEPKPAPATIESPSVETKPEAAESTEATAEKPKRPRKKPSADTTANIAAHTTWKRNAGIRGYDQHRKWLESEPIGAGEAAA